MIIDFHAHIFPDELAPQAIRALSEGIDDVESPVSDGTAAGLLKNMDDWNIDMSVIQPVVTKQTHMRKTNEWAAAAQADRLVSFGSIYPHTDDYKRDIDFIVGLGLKGLKFHAEFQDFVVDDGYMLKIYDYALEKGLVILHHAGGDPAYRPPFKSSPQQFAHIDKEMRGGVIIAAHLGGYDQWDDVETHLAGSNIYFDTSMGFEYYPRDQFLRIVEKHGADKILFASDAPWSNACSEYELLKAMPLSKGEIDDISCGNAMRLLGIKAP